MTKYASFVTLPPRGAGGNLVIHESQQGPEVSSMFEKEKDMMESLHSALDALSIANHLSWEQGENTHRDAIRVAMLAIQELCPDWPDPPASRPRRSIERLSLRELEERQIWLRWPFQGNKIIVDVQDSGRAYHATWLHDKYLLDIDYPAPKKR